MKTHQIPVSVFLSYAHEDGALLRQLETHLSLLKRQGLISTWHNQQLVPGANQVEVIDERLKQASIILLLVSPDFLDSNSCYLVEMQYALEQHKTGEAQVIPIILRPADWKSAPFAHLHALPTDAKAITTWHNQDEAFVDVVIGIRQTIKELSLPTANSSYTTQPTVWNIPHTHNFYFTGRDEFLSQLRKLLDAEPTHPYAISGLGGIGKTQTVVEYAYHHRQHYKAVLWVYAATTEALVTSYIELAHLLGLQQKDDADAKVVRESVKGWLQSHDQWLLIFDNADEPDLLNDFLPMCATGHILITTRAHNLYEWASRLHLDEFDEATGALFLLRRIGHLSLHASLDQANEDEQKLARELSHELGGLPLALAQAGAYIDKTQKSLADYLALYHTHHAKLLSRHKDVPRDYSEPVATTWNISFERMVQQNSAAIDLFYFCAFLASDAIPEEMITMGARYLGKRLQNEIGDPLAFDELLEAALSYSLLERDGERRMLLIHRLVQVVIRDRLDKEKQREWQERVIKVLAIPEVFPWSDFKVWKQCERVLPHALECLRWQDHKTFVSMHNKAICWKTARYFTNHARYKEAESFLERTVYIDKQLQHESQVSAPDPLLLNELASLYHAQGRYKDAELLYKQALYIHEQLLTTYYSNSDEREHLFLLTKMSDSLNNLAVLYYDLKRYTEAEPLYKQSLNISKQIYGPKHPDTAQSINNLAGLYHAQNRSAEAETLFQQALAIREQVLGSDHPAVALTLTALATLYRDQKKYEQAELFYQRALNISEQAHISGHTDVATIQNNLANLYEITGKKNEAELFYQRALKINERLLGLQHPNTRRTQDSLARVRKSLEKQEKEAPRDS